jgi:hypothetical protein
MFQFGARVVAASGVIGFVPYVPAEDAIIIGEGSYNTLHIGFKARNLIRVGEGFGTGALHPAGVMHAGNGRVLRAEARCGVPAGIEEHEQWADVMARGDR